MMEETTPRRENSTRYERSCLNVSIRVVSADIEGNPESPRLLLLHVTQISQFLLHPLPLLHCHL